MTISTRDQLVNAMANNTSRIVIDKATIANTAAGQFHSLWRATGQPGQGAVPTTAAVCDYTLTGAIQFTQQVAPATTYAGLLEATCSNASTTLELHDRLMHMGGLAGNVTTAQTAGVDLHANLATSNLADRIGDSNYSDVQWWVEWYTDTGAGGTNLTAAVTYNDGSTGNLTAVTLATNRRASFLQPLNSLIPAAASGLYIRSVDTITLSGATASAGDFGVTATRYRGSLFMPTANARFTADWAALGLPEVPNDSCLQLVVLCSTSNTGALRGTGKLLHG